MSTIEVKQNHSLTQEEAKSRLAGFEEQLAKYGAKLEWSGSTAELKGMGVSGDAAVTDEVVTVRVKLGILAKAAGVDPERLKGSLEKRLASALSEDQVAT